MAGNLPQDDGPPTEAELDRAAERAAQRIQRFAAVRAKIVELSVTEAAAGGAIRATVSSTGALTNVELAGRAARLTANEAVAQLVACVQRAQARIADHVAALMRAELGDDPAIEPIVSDYRQRFPAPPPPAPSRPAPSHPAAPTPADPPLAAAPLAAPTIVRRGAPGGEDDDWGNQSFLVRVE